MSAHALQPPHTLDNLTLPDDCPELEHFFRRCLETREFQEAQSEREQVHLCMKWAHEHCNATLTLQQLADFFNLAKSTVAFHLTKPFEFFRGCSAGKAGRPGLLRPDEAEALRTFIRERFSLHLPTSYEDLRDFLEEEFEKIVNINCLRNWMARNEEFKSVVGVPMEDSRAYADPDRIDEYFAKVAEILAIGDIPAAFVVIVDESGFDQFVDTRRSVRIVPREYEFNTVPVPVTRAEKRATLVAAICADGSAIRPMVILQRETVEEELLVRGYTGDKVHFARSEKGFMTTFLFNEWAEKTFIPEMRRKRADHRYDGPALLLLDGFGCHHCDAFLRMMEEENIAVVFFPPHTSDQIQPCDLGIFSNQKRWQGNIRVDDGLNKQTKQVIRIVDSYRMATTAKNVVSAFRKGGIVTYVDRDKMQLKVRVDVGKATAVRHYAHLHAEDANGTQRVKI